MPTGIVNMGHGEGIVLMANVLLVDDEASLRDTVKAILERQGHDVAVATTGLEAWEILLSSEEDFDQIISDNNMPELQGVELLQRVREDVRFKRIPFALMTAIPLTADGQSLKDICAGLNAKFYDKGGLRVTRMVDELL